MLLIALAAVTTACSPPAPPTSPTAQTAATDGVIDTALTPGVGYSLVTDDARAAPYFDNAEAVLTGKRLFGQYNCSGCHSNGGGGMGPSLMDDEMCIRDRATSALDAQPDMILEMPEDSFAPVVLAAGLALLFVGLLLKAWPLVAVGAAVVALGILTWLWPRKELRERVLNPRSEEPAHG